MKCFAFFAVVLLAGRVFAADVDNPDYVSWAKHPVGTVIHVTLQTVAAGGTVEKPTTALVTEKLVDVTPEQLLLEVSVTADTKGRPLATIPQQKIIQAKCDAAEAAFPPEGATGVQTSQEKVTVGGKEIATTKTEFVYELPDIHLKIHDVIWRSALVPGMTVKEESYPMDSPEDVSKNEVTAVNEGAAAAGVATEPAGGATQPAGGATQTGP